MPVNDAPGLPPAWSEPIDPVDAEAAAWLVRHDRGLSPAEVAAFAAWRTADARHDRAWRRLEQTWRALEQVPARRVPAAGPPWRLGTWIGLAAAAAVVVGWVGFGSKFPRATWSDRVATAEGGFQRIDLPDGSVVRLNAGSEVEVALGPRERRVQLVRGEASFAVAKDPARPFVVRVGGVDVRAVGTAFNVRWSPDAIEVLVTEGRVRLDAAETGRNLVPPAGATADLPAAAAPPLLVAGQRATIATPPPAAEIPAAAVAPSTPDDAARVLAWQTRRLEFAAEPLAAIVAEFNRYNRHQLVIDDPALAQRRFGGRFQAGDNETFVRLIEANLGVQVERRPGETRLRGAPAAAK